jgi:hypothetical protein
MPPELHMHPDRLLAHAATASGLSEDLRAALRGAPADHGPVAGEHERLLGAVGVAVRELAELSAALAAAAAFAITVEAEVGARFRGRT